MPRSFNFLQTFALKSSNRTATGTRLTEFEICFVRSSDIPKWESNFNRLYTTLKNIPGVRSARAIIPIIPVVRSETVGSAAAAAGSVSPASPEGGLVNY